MFPLQQALPTMEPVLSPSLPTCTAGSWRGNTCEHYRLRRRTERGGHPPAGQCAHVLATPKEDGQAPGPSPAQPAPGAAWRARGRRSKAKADQRLSQWGHRSPPPPCFSQLTGTSFPKGRSKHRTSMAVTKGTLFLFSLEFRASSVLRHWGVCWG